MFGSGGTDNVIILNNNLLKIAMVTLYLVAGKILLFSFISNEIWPKQFCPHWFSRYLRTILSTNDYILFIILHRI